MMKINDTWKCTVTHNTDYVLYKFSTVDETLTCMRCSDCMMCCIAILYLIHSRLLSVGESVDFNL